jgi:hypothetical protein
MRALVKLLTIIWGGGLLLQLLLSVALVYALTIDRAMLAGSILNYVAFLAHWSSRRSRTHSVTFRPIVWQRTSYIYKEGGRHEAGHQRAV